MFMNCEIILRWSATPEQLTALGTALWRRCTRAGETTGIYQYLDNQALADLIAGKLPASSQFPCWTDRRSVHVRVQGKAFPNPQATIDSLRGEIPVEAVEDIAAGCSSSVS